MAYRAPRFSYVHAIRDVGVAAITLSDAASADFPVDNLIDDRAGTKFQFNASAVNPTIDIDLGASFDTGLSRLIIPSNHNIESITVEDDDAADFVGATTLHAADTSINAGTLYDSGPFDTGNSTQRYIRITINGTAQFKIPQLILTKIVTLVNGPFLRDSRDAKVANVARQVQPTGLSPTVQLGPQQRAIDYEYPLVEGADLTAMELLVNAVGMSFPFFVDPASFSTPPETDEPVLWMKFAEMPNSSNTVLVPSSQSRSKSYQLRLIESLD